MQIELQSLSRFEIDEKNIDSVCSSLDNIVSETADSLKQSREAFNGVYTSFLSTFKGSDNTSYSNTTIDEFAADINELVNNMQSVKEQIIDYSNAGMKRTVFAEGALGVFEGIADGALSLLGQIAVVAGATTAADTIFGFVSRNLSGELLSSAYDKYSANSTVSQETLDLYKGIGSGVVYVGLAIAAPGSLSFEIGTSALAGHGQMVQAALQDGDDYQTALNKGYVAGAVAGLTEVVMDKGFAEATNAISGKVGQEVLENVPTKFIHDNADKIIRESSASQVLSAMINEKNGSMSNSVGGTKN